MVERASSNSTAEAAFALSIRDSGEATDEVFWAGLTEAFQDRLRGAVEADHENESEGASERLRRWHSAEAHVDLSRIHSTWIVRALREESPAVVRTVVRNSSGRIEAILRREFGLDDTELDPRHEPDPESVWRALILWTERLVGGAPSPDDPPVVVALSRLGSMALLRLAHEIGTLKRTWAVRGTKASGSGTPFEPAIDRFDPRFPALTLREVEALPTTDFRGIASLGLTTAARLLSLVEPTRVRWTLQHLPYTLAKQIRARMSVVLPKTRLWIGGESLLVEHAIRGLEARQLLEWPA
ncbi:hypothetical protein EP7_003712 [Isosphaeraceae bacterium EP7]